MTRTTGAVFMSVLLVTATLATLTSAAAGNGGVQPNVETTEPADSVDRLVDGEANAPARGAAGGAGESNGGSGNAGPGTGGTGNGGQPSSPGNGGAGSGGGGPSGSTPGKATGQDGSNPGKAKGRDGSNPGKARGHGEENPGRGRNCDVPGRATGRGNSNPGKSNGHDCAGGTGGGPPVSCRAQGSNGTAGPPTTNRAGPPANATCGRNGTVRGWNVSVDRTKSALELRVTAWRLLEGGTTRERGPSLSASEAAALRETLNGSFRYFVGFDRIENVSVLADDKAVVAATGRAVPNVSARLVVADEKLAATAIDDAERVRALLRDRNVSFDEATVDREIAKARRAFDQAGHVRSTSPNPVAASTHYRRAWEHAQRALDAMDAATAPRVNVTSRADPAHGVPINYTVRGTVFDVRPWRIQNVTVAVNGTERAVVPVFAGNATPGQTWRFAARVSLNGSVHRVTVSATDSGEVVAEGSESFVPNAGTDVLRLDADRLPDRYEATRTTTDPLDTDSDASATNASEGNDGVDDGAADLDGDRLTNLEERELGTDPLDPDTDGDRLRDAFEVLVTDTDPLSADSDGDGTPDGEEDPDGDKLFNVKEQREGSDPLRVDGDFDGLSDPEELRLGTNPIHPDTDEDGLVDSRELEAPFETDPLDPDTDDDGVLDGEETYTTTVRNESVGARVDVTGAGDASAATSVRRDTEPFLNTTGTRTAGVSERVRVDVDREFGRPG